MKRPFLFLLIAWLLALLLPKAALASFTNHFAAWPSRTTPMVTSPLPENGWPEASISLALGELRLESCNGLFCNDDPVGNYDPIGEDTLSANSPTDSEINSVIEQIDPLLPPIDETLKHQSLGIGGQIPDQYLSLRANQLKSQRGFLANVLRARAMLEPDDYGTGAVDAALRSVFGADYNAKAEVGGAGSILGSAGKGPNIFGRAWGWVTGLFRSNPSIAEQEGSILQDTGAQQITETQATGLDVATDAPAGVILENSSATSKASRELAQSLLESGPKPFEGAQAAHIVPTLGNLRNDVEAARGFVTAQTKMETYLPGMRNNAINGFWEIPGHAGTHKDIYYRALGEEFSNVSSKEGALRALANMRARIMAGEFQ